MRAAPWLLLLTVAFPAPSPAQQPIDFARGWELSGEQTRVDTVDGRTVLRIRSGAARLRSVSLGDGTIEFDMAVTPYRSFVYLNFRMQADGEYEEIYFRPHKSGLPDAVQYSPVFRGTSNWQLYHGAGYTGAPRLPPSEWIHVRLVLSGSRAALFVGNVTQPQLVIPLVRDPGAGSIALRSFLVDPDAPAEFHSASFRNLVIRPGQVTDFPPPVPASAPPAGLITQWQVSEPFAPDSGVITRLPQVTWRTLDTDGRGLLVFTRHFSRPAGVQRPAVLARVSVPSDRARMARFDFGFSDEVSVFLNGQLLYAADQSYSFDEPRREGLVGLDQGTLFLPLRAGQNELVLAISDVFGGWGVMGRLESRN